MTPCPTCNRRPSERTLARFVDDGDGYVDDMSEECSDPIHDLADLAGEMLDALVNLSINADLAGDPRMHGMTDCYLATLDDIAAARAVLAKVAR